MQLKPIHASFLCGLAFANGLRGVVMPSSKAVPKSSQRSAVAIRPPSSSAYGSDGTFMPLPNLDTEDFHLPSISLAPPTKSNQPATTATKATPSTLTTELWGEAFGTFWIVGVGSMASMAATFDDPFTVTPLPEIALVWSAAVASAIALCSSQKWGEAHFNPAITLVSAIFRGLDWDKVVPYMGAQVAGATMGSAMAFAMHSQSIGAFETQQDIVRASSTETARVFGEYFDGLTATQAFGVEALGTAILAAMAFGLTHPSTANRHGLSIPLVMGGTVFTLINWLAPYTQAGMNPARDFGPRLVAYAAGWTDVAFQDCWVYLAAPLVGAIMGAALVEGLLADEKR